MNDCLGLGLYFFAPSTSTLIGLNTDARRIDRQ